MSVVDKSRRDGEGEEELATMTLTEHLAELRSRVLVSIIAIALATVVMWFLYDHVIDFMRSPYCDFIRGHPSKALAGRSCSLVTQGPLEGFTTRLKICAYGGIALSSPALFWELWRFITPGLHKNEKRYIVPFVACGVVLFALGVTVAILVFPKALTWLINVGGTGVVPLFSPARYFTLYVLMCLIFGVVFTYPLVLVFLEIAGVVPSTTWRRWRRPAIVIIALVAAVITPSSDPFSFLAMAVPMIVFYEASIVVGRVLHK
ncbi:MAG: twin-arginine translocase subunit TatC [Acidimicrobiaceae bacterium]|nr:twin-arginine translocase subunit TatC [Acidimicrobiaceae bacterium]MBO0747421.1 twin-arginine translocase subunit TatC [Acidimicrobiaceae bacterium]